MRFEELAYTVDGLEAMVRFHDRLTVVGIPADERSGWITRLLGVLEGTRAGDSTSTVYADDAGIRIRLDRDDQGGATLTDVESGAELPYSARHLSLDGRFDWFASIGITSRTAEADMVLGPDVFIDDEAYDPGDVEEMLTEARRELDRVARKRRSAESRSRRRDALRQGLADLEVQIRQDEPTQSGGSAAEACRKLAERRDTLVAALDKAASGTAASDAYASDASDPDAYAYASDAYDPDASDPDASDPDEILRELTDAVEPAFVDALAALADACRLLGVTVDAARIAAAGITADGIERLTTEVMGELPAVLTTMAERSRLVEALQRAEQNVPDLAELSGRHAALLRQVATLEAMRHDGRRLVSAEEAEPILRQHAARARRARRRREPLPLVVNDALAPFAADDKRALLDAVAALGETTQIIYLTDDPDTLAWASTLVGPGQVSLCRPNDIATVA